MFEFLGYAALILAAIASCLYLLGILAAVSYACFNFYASDDQQKE